MDPIENQLRILKSLGFAVLEELDLGEDAPARSATAGTSAATPARPAARTQPAPAAAKLPFAEPLSAAEPRRRADGPVLSPEERVAALAAIVEEVAGCTACRLCHGRTRTVPGEGNPMAELMFVGEGPGQEEDRQGRPFVGRAGELLTKIIEAMQFRREDVFIANVVKCRPPGNRTPEPDEMSTCLPYLRRQIDILRPRAIVALGKTALVGLLPEHANTGITKLRGQWMEFNGTPLMPTFHPAYLLRSPAQKVFVWEDMQQVMKLFGKTPKK